MLNLSMHILFPPNSRCDALHNRTWLVDWLKFSLVYVRIYIFFSLRAQMCNFLTYSSFSPSYSALTSLYSRVSRLSQSLCVFLGTASLSNSPMPLMLCLTVSLHLIRCILIFHPLTDNILPYLISIH